MTSGIASKGVDLDNIFHAYISGTHPPATGIKVNGVDIATRYQPLPGTPAPATGIMTDVADLNTLFSTTASAPLPIDGQTFQRAYSVISGSGWSEIGFGFEVVNEITQYQVYGSDSAHTPTPIASGPLPSGATKVQFTWGSYTTPTLDSGGSTSNSAATPTAISANPTAFYQTGSFGSSAASHQRNYTFTIDFFNASGANISHTVITLIAVIEGSS